MRIHAKIPYAFLIASLFVSASTGISARRVNRTLKTPPTRELSHEDEYVSGSQAISTECEDCGGGYTVRDVVFSGYDKKRSSDKESFFVTNKSDRVLTGINLYITYKDSYGRQLHKQFLKLLCNILPGETNKIDIRSWDTQRSFYYVKSEDNPKKGSPFTVEFDPVTIYLRFPDNPSE